MRTVIGNLLVARQEAEVGVEASGVLRMHEPVAEVDAWLRNVVTGYYHLFSKSTLISRPGKAAIRVKLNDPGSRYPRQAVSAGKDDLTL